MADILMIVGLVFGALAFVTTSASSLLNASDSKKKGEQITKLEIEKLQLEQALSPRLIDQSKLSSEIKTQADIHFDLITLPEFETRRTTGQIKVALEMAGWNFNKQIIANVDDGLMMFDGVIVEINVGVIETGDNSKKAADLLVAALIAQGIQARTHPSRTPIPPNTIRVKVGMKPIDYFLDKTPGNVKGNMSF